MCFNNTVPLSSALLTSLFLYLFFTRDSFPSTKAGFYMIIINASPLFSAVCPHCMFIAKLTASVLTFSFSLILKSYTTLKGYWRNVAHHLLVSAQLVYLGQVSNNLAISKMTNRWTAVISYHWLSLNQLAGYLHQDDTENKTTVSRVKLKCKNIY